MIGEILEKLDMEGCVCDLPSGFHASVVLVKKGRSQKVVKVISKDYLKNKKTAFLLAEDIHAYYHGLKSIGVPTPDNKTFLFKNGRRWDLVVVSPFCGHNVSNVIRSGPEPESLAAISAILSVIEKFFARRLCPGCPEMVFGIDPKPDNFTVDSKGKMHYVDLMPPRYRKDGRALVEFPPPASLAGYDLAYFRHFDIRGVMLVLRTQLCRLRPGLRPQILGLLSAFCREKTNGNMAAFFRDFAGDRFNEADAGLRRRFINGIGAEDMYLIRDIAAQVAYENPVFFETGAMEEVFHLTHFYDDVPAEENIKKIKKILKKYLRK